MRAKYTSQRVSMVVGTVEVSSSPLEASDECVELNLPSGAPINKPKIVTGILLSKERAVKDKFSFCRQPHPLFPI